MNAKNIAIGGVIGAVSLYVLGYVLWELILGSQLDSGAIGFAAGMSRETGILWSQIVALLAYGIFLTVAVQSQPGATTFGKGVRVCLIAGILVWTAADLLYFTWSTVWALGPAIVDIVLETTRATISGGIIAVVLSKLPG